MGQSPHPLLSHLQGKVKSARSACVLGREKGRRRPCLNWSGENTADPHFACMHNSLPLFPAQVMIVLATVLPTLLVLGLIALGTREMRALHGRTLFGRVKAPLAGDDTTLIIRWGQGHCGVSRCFPLIVHV